MAKTTGKIAVVVADDHPVVLHGVVALLSADPEVEVVGTALSGTAALDCVLKTDPDIAILDLAMPGMNGIEVLRRLGSAGMRAKVIILTAVADDSHILAAVAGGACGLMSKDTAPDALVECVKKVAGGLLWLPADIVAQAIAAEGGHPAGAHQFEEHLTDREREVMRLTVRGLPNKEIARKLNISEGTIKIHLHNLYAKVGVTNRTALAALALTYWDRVSIRPRPPKPS